MFFVSAGHHPSKPGACFGSFCEYDEAALWSDLIVRSFRKIQKTKTWLPPIMRVPGLTLRNKTDFINARAPKFAVEIHFSAKLDAAGQPTGSGCQTLYYPGCERGLACAGIMQENINEIFPPDRGPREGYYRDDKAKGPVWFLERTKCTALIIEPDFIHRKEKIQAYRDVACDAIAVALAQCYTRVLEG